LQRSSPYGAVDTESIVATLSRGRPLVTVPRRVVWTITPRAHLFVDDSEAMAPFAGDADILVAAVSSSSADRTIVTRFGGVGSPRTPTALPTGVRCVVFSDVGIGRPSSTFSGRHDSSSAWPDFFEALAARRCRAVLLIPYGSDRWPWALTASATRHRLAACCWREDTPSREMAMVGRLLSQGR
jgi:hypothetical protein